jgi:hypothetical protein
MQNGPTESNQVGPSAFLAIVNGGAKGGQALRDWSLMGDRSEADLRVDDEPPTSTFRAAIPGEIFLMPNELTRRTSNYGKGS